MSFTAYKVPYDLSIQTREQNIRQWKINTSETLLQIIALKQQSRFSSRLACCGYMYTMSGRMYIRSLLLSTETADYNVLHRSNNDKISWLCFSTLNKYIHNHQYSGTYYRKTEDNMVISIIIIIHIFCFSVIFVTYNRINIKYIYKYESDVQLEWSFNLSIYLRIKENDWIWCYVLYSE